VRKKNRRELLAMEDPWKIVFDSWVFCFPCSDACASSVVDYVVSFLVLGKFGAPQKWLCL